MSLILSGTDGLSDVDGSASTPAIRGTDTNTGIFFPAADTIAFAEGGAEVARFDSSGNLGIGTSSPTMYWSGSNKGLSIAGTSNGAEIDLKTSGSTSTSYLLQDVGFNFNIGNSGAYPIRFYTSDAERMRIDSSGNLLVGRTSTFASERLVVEGSSTSFITRLRNTSATTPAGLFVSYTAAAPNDTGNEFIRCDDNAATRMTVRSNGGIANYSANNVNLSDIRTKTDIELAGNYLDKICSIQVKTFKYKDQTDTELNLGVIAQDVEAVAPELVDVSGFGETPEDGVPLKAIYQTDLVYALMKSIQELKAEVDSLKAQLNK
jgi:hypothetical protein